MSARVSLMIVAAAAAAALTGCGGKEPHKTEAAPVPPVPVRTTVAQKIEWPSTYETVGTIRARSSATVASRIMGYIREMRVRAGDRVKAGQLIAVIDSRDLEAGYQQAQAAVTEARSGMAEADNGIASAKAQLELAEVTFKRMEDLYGKRSISNQEFDEARSRLRVAQAAYEMAVSKRNQIDARVNQAVQGARAAAVTRGYAEVRAPFAGVVTEKRAEQGDMASPGMPLVTVEQAGGFNLEVPVEEARLGIIRAGQAVSVKLDALDQTISGKVAEILPAVDPASRSFTVKIALPHDQRLQSGLFGRARFSLGTREAVAIPASAIGSLGQVRSVFVVENGTARARLVTLGEQHGDLLEVLSGVAAGERVVSPRPANLQDGARVEVRP